MKTTMIRTFDFEPIPGRTVCYIEGVVLEDDGDFVVFRPTCRVWDGMMDDGSKLPIKMRTLKANMMSHDWAGRVTFWEVD